MKLKLFSPRTRDALIAALLLILICGIAAGILSSTRTPDDPISLDAGEKVDRLSRAQEGESILLASSAGDEYFAAMHFPTLTGAVGDGKTDDTQALKDALARARETGGTVYLPQGTYCLSEPLVIPAGVTLRGDFTAPDAASAERTVFYVEDSESLQTSPLFTLESGASLVGITVYYREQTPLAVKEYPATVFCTGSNRVDRLALINPYHGICVTGDGKMEISSVWMSPLDYGILVTENNGSVKISDLSVSPTYWLNATPALFSAAGSYDALTRRVHGHLHGILLEKVTDVTVLRCSVDDAWSGLFFNVPKEQEGGLLVSEISLTSVDRPLWMDSLPASGICVSDSLFRPVSDSGSDTVHISATVEAPVVFSDCLFSGSPKTVIHGENSSLVSFYHCDFGTWWNSCFTMSDSTFLAVEPIFRTAQDKATLGKNGMGILYGAEAMEDSSELLFSVTEDAAVPSASEEVKALKDTRKQSPSLILFATDFGCSPELADNASALNEALRQAKEQGATLFLPEGEYRLGSVITVPESVRLVGAGNEGSYKTTLIFQFARGSEGRLVTLSENASVENLSILQQVSGDNLCGIGASAANVRVRNVKIRASHGIRLEEATSPAVERVLLETEHCGIEHLSVTGGTVRDLTVIRMGNSETFTGILLSDSQVTVSEYRAEGIPLAAKVTGTSDLKGTLWDLAEVSAGVLQEGGQALLTCSRAKAGETLSALFDLKKGTVTVQGLLCRGTPSEGGMALISEEGEATLRGVIFAAPFATTVKSAGEGTVNVTGCIWDHIPTLHALAADGTVTLNGNLLYSEAVFEGIEGNYLRTETGENATVDDGVNVMKFTYKEGSESGSESGSGAEAGEAGTGTEGAE